MRLSSPLSLIHSFLFNMRFFVRLSTFVTAWILLIFPVQAYHLVITGTAKGLNSRQVYLNCSAWVEAQISVLSEQDRFAFVVDNPYPAMYELQYGIGTATLKTELFAFSDLNIDATLVSENGNEQIFLRIPDYRSNAFKTAKNYTNDLYVSKSPNEVKNILSRIKNIPNIQKEDHYTDVFARSEMLDYANVLTKDYGIKYETEVFKRPEFDSLPINDERYYGFPSYKELMVTYYDKNIQNKIMKDQRSIYDFQTLMHYTDSMSTSLPEIVRFDLITNVLKRFRFNTLPNLQQQDLYSLMLKRMINQHPNHPSITELELKMVDIFNSLVNRPAPEFELKDMEGKKVKLTDFKGTFVLLDVWGSWCRPCRAKAPELRELNQTIKDYSMEVKLVGIANEQDPESWKDAIIQDNMAWLQLLADPQFLANYNIKEYPMMILIDKEGKVKKVGPNISLSDLIDIMY